MEGRAGFSPGPPFDLLSGSALLLLLNLLPGFVLWFLSFYVINAGFKGIHYGIQLIDTGVKGLFCRWILGVQGEAA